MPEIDKVLPVAVRKERKPKAGPKASKAPKAPTAVKVKKAPKAKASVVIKAPPKPEMPDLKCGFVSIIGRPNTGKSTLLNYIVGEKISIVSDVPQTTRKMLRGIYTDKRGQVVFIDTPGWHLGRDNLDRYMNQACVNAIEGVDCIIHTVDSSERVGEEERRVVARLKNQKVPIIVALNKIDLKGKFIAEYVELWESARGMPVSEMKDFVLLPLSGRDGIQVDQLLEVVFSFLPQGPMLYEPDIVTDVPRKQAVADIIREKLFLLTREEVPHAIAVEVEEMRPVKGKTTYIRAAILVERQTQKEIVIGNRGSMVKQVGSLARTELEALLETKVFLELFVKFRKNWRDDHDLLVDMGYSF
ncbi:MAG: GTPase Era [Candidatus Omnitrophica bacterium]|nr:GTPase Era [Candidatus Omnitrophota bacterium]